MSSVASFDFDHHFAQLPPSFYTKMAPEAVGTNPQLIHLNKDVAQMLGLANSILTDADFPLWFSGHKSLPGGDPLAMVYSGHQFGVWAGQLGDGRALLLGQMRDKQHRSWDLQLKGSGKTPYSRMGDGRAVLRSSIREYLAGEALNGLSIPTTRALCLIKTNEKIQREILEDGAIITRISPSHLRFGHFEHFCHHGHPEKLPILMDYILKYYYPDCRTAQEYYAALVTQTAELIAKWQAVGFAHGVMNSDNMSAIGLTIDYGPYGFMEQFNPGFICNHSDYQGRYAFNQQPAIGLWNLYALAHALRPLFPLEEAEEILKNYHPHLQQHYHQLMAAKLGLPLDPSISHSLIDQLINGLTRHKADYTNAFRDLGNLQNDTDRQNYLDRFDNDPIMIDFLDGINQQTAGLFHSDFQTHIKKQNPKYILRNWVAEKVIRAVTADPDDPLLDQVITLLQDPYKEHPDFDHLAQLPPDGMANLSVSCSS